MHKHEFDIEFSNMSQFECFTLKQWAIDSNDFELAAEARKWENYYNNQLDPINFGINLFVNIYSYVNKTI